MKVLILLLLCCLCIVSCSHRAKRQNWEGGGFGQGGQNFGQNGGFGAQRGGFGQGGQNYGQNGGFGAQRGGYGGGFNDRRRHHSSSSSSSSDSHEHHRRPRPRPIGGAYGNQGGNLGPPLYGQTGVGQTGFGGNTNPVAGLLSGLLG